MESKISVELFRFNHKTDYLPYFKKYQLQYTKDETVMDLLKKINSIEKFSFDGVDKFGVKINNLFVDNKELINNIVTKTSNTLTIEPVSNYRATNDLTINNQDFIEKLELFDKYITTEQKNSYINTLQLLYYSSNSLNFNKDYIGDHMLLIADDILKASPDFENEILSILKDKNKGGWYHTSLNKRVLNLNSQYEEKIYSTLSKIVNKKDKTTKTDPKDTNITQKFTDFNIAVYDNDDTSSIETFVIKSDAKYVNTISKNDDLALHSLEINKNFTYKIAANILLDAKDNNADFLIVNDEDIFKLFDNEQKEIEKTAGRQIDLPIVTFDQFSYLLSGEKDTQKLGFNKHKVTPNFL